MRASLILLTVLSKFKNVNIPRKRCFHYQIVFFSGKREFKYMQGYDFLAKISLIRLKTFKKLMKFCWSALIKYPNLGLDHAFLFTQGYTSNFFLEKFTKRDKVFSRILTKMIANFVHHGSILKFNWNLLEYTYSRRTFLTSFEWG